MWQWRKFENNKVVAVSDGSFRSRPACVKNAITRGYIDGVLTMCGVSHTPDDLRHSDVLRGVGLRPPDVPCAHSPIASKYEYLKTM